MHETIKSLIYTSLAILQQFQEKVQRYEKTESKARLATELQGTALCRFSAAIFS
jgi:hypothetical protein